MAKSDNFLVMDGLSGPEGVLVATIVRAVKDAGGRSPEQRDDARAYLASWAFRHHVEALGLAPRALPVIVEVAADERR